MSIKQGLAYTVTPHKVKRYASHYETAEKCLVVPLKIFGSEVSCDIRWQDNGGNIHLLQNKFFACENLIPLDAMSEFELYALWLKHYNSDNDQTSKPITIN